MKFEKNATVYYDPEVSHYVDHEPKYTTASHSEFVKELAKRLDLNESDVTTIMKAIEDLLYDYLSIAGWEQNVAVWFTRNICMRSTYIPEHLVAYEEDKDYRLVQEGFDYDTVFNSEFDEKCKKRLKTSRVIKDLTEQLEAEKRERELKGNKGSEKR